MENNTNVRLTLVDPASNQVLCRITFFELVCLLALITLGVLSFCRIVRDLFAPKQLPTIPTRIRPGQLQEK